MLGSAWFNRHATLHQLGSSDWSILRHYETNLGGTQLVSVQIYLRKLCRAHPVKRAHPCPSCIPQVRLVIVSYPDPQTTLGLGIWVSGSFLLGDKLRFLQAGDSKVRDPEPACPSEVGDGLPNAGGFSSGCPLKQPRSEASCT